MKILAIRGRNLASLEGDFEIDFTQEPLRSSGIYAITGNTGAGKSTLLDALCLALFDNTPRMSRAGENVQITDVKNTTISQKDSRSILRRGAGEGMAEVDFVALSGEQYRANWSVRRARNKADGALQSSTVQLLNLSTNLEMQGTKKELLDQITELIGLSFEQFTRAVLLAQGDFATFLKAKQTEKAELLEKLTGTDIYSKISISIYGKTKEAELQLSALHEKIKDVQLLSEEDVNELNTEKELLLKETNTLKEQLNILTEKIKWVKEEQALLLSIKSAEEELANSNKQVEDAQPRYALLKKVECVQEIRDAFKAWQHARKQLTDTQTNLDKQEKKRAECLTILNMVKEKENELTTKQKQYQHDLEQILPQLKQARELDINIVHARKAQQESEKELKESSAGKLQLEKKITTLKAKSEETAKNIQTLSDWFEQNQEYKDIVTRIDLILNLIDDAGTAKTQQENNTKTLSSVEQLLTTQTEKLEKLSQEATRLNAILPSEVVILRTQLEEGVPCPVCGSKEHPYKGEVSHLQSLQEEVLNKAKEDNQKEIASTSSQMESHKTEITRLQSVIQSYSKQTQESFDKLDTYLAHTPTWRNSFDKGDLKPRLERFSQKWKKDSELLTQSKEEATEQKILLQNEQQKLEELGDSLQAKEIKHKEHIAVLEKLKEERGLLLAGKDADLVEKSYADQQIKLTELQQTVQKEREESTAWRDSLQGIIQQLTTEKEKTKQSSNELEEEVNTWLSKRQDQFSIEQLAELLTKDMLWLTQEREVLNSLKEAVIKAEATQHERKTNLNKHYNSEYRLKTEEERESILQEQAEQSRLLSQTERRNMEIQLAFTNHEKGKERIKEFEKELQEKTELTESWKKLNDLLGSASGSKFKEIAQGYTLDALLTYANKHLSELSKRYQLQRVPDTLALQVIDLDMVGEIRSVHLLSGGESFLISLALALGLSSLSSNRMKIESLFIDEGFGSLDVDTLRIAMDALEQLQTQGRKIGVISHVAEMTEHITTQIRVIKVNNGKSKVEVIGGFCGRVDE
jgi:ATPase involved in DNA repair